MTQNELKPDSEPQQQYGVVICCAILLVVIVSAIAVTQLPGLNSAIHEAQIVLGFKQRPRPDAAHAISAIRTIVAAQSIFVEQSSTQRYAKSLTELSPDKSPK